MFCSVFHIFLSIFDIHSLIKRCCPSYNREKRIYAFFITCHCIVSDTPCKCDYFTAVFSACFSHSDRHLSHGALSIKPANPGHEDFTYSEEDFEIPTFIRTQAD